MRGSIIDPSQGVLIGIYDLANHNANPPFLSDKQIRQESRLILVD